MNARAGRTGSALLSAGTQQHAPIRYLLPSQAFPCPIRGATAMASRSTTQAGAEGSGEHRCRCNSKREALGDASRKALADHSAQSPFPRPSRIGWSKVREGSF